MSKLIRKLMNQIESNNEMKKKEGLLNACEILHLHAHDYDKAVNNPQVISKEYSNYKLSENDFLKLINILINVLENDKDGMNPLNDTES